MSADDTHDFECLLLPGNPLPAEMELARPLPCFVVLVHGVNDLGETYAAQETGILAGLNRRLHREDLRPAAYRLPPARDDASEAARKELHTALDDPDAVYYKRSVDPESAWNPVIPFYWGSRVDTSRKDATRLFHGQLVDRHGNRLDRNGAKEGGPVANATSNLIDMWAQGFNDKVLGFFHLNALAGQPTHPLLHADERRYMILAAQRLAMVVQMIRDRNAQAVVNLVAHSQGCLVSLLAQGILARAGQRRADCLILNHPCYSLEEPRIEKLTQTHDHQQTTHARVATLRNLVQLVTQSPQARPALATLLDPGRNGGLTGPPGDSAYADRDNRGRVFLYFCPEDATVGLKSMQGIGWQGVPDHKEGQPVLAALGPRFHQRVWTMRARRGVVPRVGEGTQYVLREKGEAFWSYNLSHTLRATPTVDEPRILASGVDLPVPFTPNLQYGESKGHAGFLDVGPCDAVIAITNGGERKTIHSGTGDVQSLTREDVDDWRDPSSQTQWLNPRDLRQLEEKLNAGKGKDDRIQVLGAERLWNGKLRVQYAESDTAAQIRWQTQELEVNSHHSAIVGNPDHSRHVTAWDLAIGPARICKDQTKAESYSAWVKETREFVSYLCTVADWRMDSLALGEFRKDPYFSGFFTEDVEHKALLDATAIYYTSGALPEDLLLTTEDLQPLVVSQTIAEFRQRSLTRNRL